MGSYSIVKGGISLLRFQLASTDLLATKVAVDLSKLNRFQLRYDVPNIYSIHTSPLLTRLNNWLGIGTKVIKNKAGDPIFLSKDGSKRLRFDFNRPSPHNNPHMHLEELIENDWVGYGQIYPKDLPHN